MTDAHERALGLASIMQFPEPFEGGQSISVYNKRRIEVICKTYLTALLDDPAMVDKIIERLAASPFRTMREDVQVAIQAIKEAAGV